MEGRLYPLTTRAVDIIRGRRFFWPVWNWRDFCTISGERELQVRVEHRSTPERRDKQQDLARHREHHILHYQKELVQSIERIWSCTWGLPGLTYN